MFVEIKNIKKSYGSAGNTVAVLKGINADIHKGNICVVLGPSGSGKSTLLNLVGGLDSVDEGSVFVDDIDITTLPQKELSIYRRNMLGFVFQFYNLIPNLTVKENIVLCANLSDNPMDINRLIDVLGLKEHADKYPSQLSGGQQQRCAIGRALIKNPALLLCDEPTGALDYNSSKEILKLLEDINRKYNMTIIIVTHNMAIKDMAHQVLKFHDGFLVENYKNDKIIGADKVEW